MWGPGKCFLCFTDTETQCDKCGIYYCDDHLSSHRLQSFNTLVLHVYSTHAQVPGHVSTLRRGDKTRGGQGRHCHQGYQGIRASNACNAISFMVL